MTSDLEMTRQQMESQFPGQYVLVGDPQNDPAGDCMRGRVLAHDRDAAKIWKAAQERCLPRIAVLFLGAPVPEGYETLL